MLGVKERRRGVYALVNEHRRDEDNNADGAFGIKEVISSPQMLGGKERRRGVYALVNEHRRDEDNNADGA